MMQDYALIFVFWNSGNVIGGINQRRGTIVDSEVREDEFTAIAEVALNDMFGYSSALRGGTQGKGEFSMEYKVFATQYLGHWLAWLTESLLDPSPCHASSSERNRDRVQKDFASV